eukprot:1156901-Pelagomonas_calceolata.AAC.2
MDGGVVFASLYAQALTELSSPDLGRIKLLRDLAKENADKASHIVTAISNHFYSCAPSMRLAALYLVDCLLKNVPVPYAPLFEQELPAVGGARMGASKIFDDQQGVRWMHACSADFMQCCTRDDCSVMLARTRA